MPRRNLVNSRVNAQSRKEKQNQNEGPRFCILTKTCSSYLMSGHKTMVTKMYGKKMPEILDKQDETLDLVSETMITMPIIKIREVVIEQGVSKRDFIHQFNLAMVVSNFT